MEISSKVAALIQKSTVITKKIYEGLRLNSYEQALLLPFMEDEVLFDVIKLAQENSSFPTQATFINPPSTYDEALVGLYLPEILRRYKSEML